MQVSDMYIRSKGQCYLEAANDVGAVAREMKEPPLSRIHGSH